MKKIFISIFISIINSVFPQAHTFDLIICKSDDGVNWTNNALFEAQSGVPSVAQHSTGLLSCVFQWFPSPTNQSNPSFDKIAVKQSSDNGVTWSNPQLINISGYPPTYKRPFDPTLVVADNGNLRLYFSASRNNLLTLLDSTVHTYSAISPDGINYTYEGVRLLVADSITIDPAVAKLGSTWHYTCPSGPPQAGAHHFISNDGLAWTRTTSVTSDMNHNWTGNLLIDGNEMKFYGTPSPQTNAIWLKQTSNGFNWGSYTNCTGTLPSSGAQADPAVVKPSQGSYLMIYVGKQTLLSSIENTADSLPAIVYPNPAEDKINIVASDKITEIKIIDTNGKIVFANRDNTNCVEPFLPAGNYIIEITTINGKVQHKLLIE